MPSYISTSRIRFVSLSLITGTEALWQRKV